MGGRGSQNGWPRNKARGRATNPSAALRFLAGGTRLALSSVRAREGRSGVENVKPVACGVDIARFKPEPDGDVGSRRELGIGRNAAREILCGEEYLAQ